MAYKFMKIMISNEINWIEMKCLCECHVLVRIFGTVAGRELLSSIEPPGQAHSNSDTSISHTGGCSRGKRSVWDRMTLLFAVSQPACL
jgi:hypothetical protein